MLLGGRVAEDVVLKEISTGAQNDLERATEIVRKMIMEYGMSEELGPMTFGHKTDNPFVGRDLSRDRNYGEEVAANIDKEVRRTMEQSYQRVKDLLNEHMDTLHLVAETLMKKETIEANEFQSLMDQAGEARRD
ncbi:MAG: cell division protein FtsH, partial [Clostridia bacterium]|nr:cell division protein FtsH [Clostridia bacterium]